MTVPATEQQTLVDVHAAAPLHLSLTGVNAGVRLCGAPREATRAVHAAYASDQTLASPDICHTCLTIWNSDLD
jgi:hypothetical protein